MQKQISFLVHDNILVLEDGMEVRALGLELHHVAHSIWTYSRGLYLPFPVCVHFAHITQEYGEICAELFLVRYVDGRGLARTTYLIWSDCKRVHKVRIVVQACALRIAWGVWLAVVTSRGASHEPFSFVFDGLRLVGLLLQGQFGVRVRLRLFGLLYILRIAFCFLTG